MLILIQHSAAYCRSSAELLSFLQPLALLAQWVVFSSGVISLGNRAPKITGFSKSSLC